MTEQASFTLRNRNPDVLTCIANLSNDEVFTPPDLANKMLDILAQAWSKDHDGDNLWENKDVKFLDPCTKSGVFLRLTKEVFLFATLFKSSKWTWLFGSRLFGNGLFGANFTFWRCTKDHLVQFGLCWGF